MDALDVILTRRSVRKMKTDAPAREQVEKLLEAAIRAPNHHITEPWRFIVIGGEALDALGDAMAERITERFAGEPDFEERVELERSRPHRAPVIISVVYVKSHHPKAIEVEDRYAVGAAMENMLLAAHAMGLGAYLRTGPAAEYQGVRKHLGIKEEEEIAGFVYLGFEEGSTDAMSRRKPVSEVTSWLWE